MINLLVDVRFQERGENQHVCHSDVGRYILGESFARTDSANHTLFVPNGLTCQRGRGRITDTVKCISKIWDSFCDLGNYVGIIVIEDMLGAILFDNIEVARAAGGDKSEAIHGCNLDCV